MLLGALVMLAIMLAPFVVAGAIPLGLALRRGPLPLRERICLLAVPLSLAATIYLYVGVAAATKWKAWVGVPLPPEVRAIFLPPLLCAVSGIVFLAYGLSRKMRTITLAGALGLAGGVAQGIAVAAMYGWADAG